MTIKHRLVTFITASAVKEAAEKKLRGKIEAANPYPAAPKLPPEPKKLDEPSLEQKARYEKAFSEWTAKKKEIETPHLEACRPVKEKNDADFAKAMAKVTITEEKEPPAFLGLSDHIVRSRTKGRCRLVGCGNHARESRLTPNPAKARRWASAFCGQPTHLAVRRQIPRKSAFFELRKSDGIGIVIG